MLRAGLLGSTWKSALSCSKCLIKFVSFADPNFILFMNIKLPRILIVFLSTPLLMRALLSLRRVDSCFLSAVDMKGFIDMLGDSDFGILCRFAKTVATSHEQVNLTTRALVLSSEYLLILKQSHTAKSLISGQIFLMALQANSVSLVMRMCLGEILRHPFRPYITILNLLST